MKTASHASKKQIILEAAKELGVERFTPAEIEQIRRQLIVRMGAAAGKTGGDYIAEVLKAAGLRVGASDATTPGVEELYEEEFHDLLHFATLEEAEMCLVRLDELLHKFHADGQRAAENRVLEVARLGRRRAEMIARNPRVDAQKRAEKEEIVQWFRVWLQTPEAFFDWLEVRKQAPEYLRLFGSQAEEAEA
jgi:hypothetical protein